jgi:hypothetical protein
MAYLSHPHRLRHSNYTRRRVQSRSSSLCSFFHTLRPKYSLSTLFSNILSLYSSMSETKFIPIQNHKQSYSLINSVTFLDSRRVDRFPPNVVLRIPVGKYPLYDFLISSENAPYLLRRSDLRKKRRVFNEKSGMASLAPTLC